LNFNVFAGKQEEQQQKEEEDVFQDSFFQFFFRQKLLLASFARRRLPNKYSISSLFNQRLRRFAQRTNVRRLSLII